jgi:hypothetical protein
MRGFLLTVGLVFVVVLAMLGSFDAPRPSFEEPELPSGPPGESAYISPAAAVLARHLPELETIEGFVAVGTGLSATGEEIIVVSVDNEDAVSEVPTELEGIPIVTEVIPGGVHIQ